MNWIAIILRWMHIFGAVALVGGSLFMWWVVLPVMKKDLRDSDGQSQTAVRQRWSKVVMVSILLLLVSGILNVFLMIQGGKFGQVHLSYHPLLLAKMVGALIVFFMISVVSGKSAMAERWRAGRTDWLGITLALALIVVGIASVMKHVPPKNSDTAPQTEEGISAYEQERKEKVGNFATALAETEPAAVRRP